MKYPGFEEAVRGEERKLIQWLTKRVGDRETAQDIAQLTFINLWRNRAAVREWSTTLVFRSAKHRMIDHLKASPRETLPLEDLHADPGTEMVLVELRADLETLLEQIPECYRGVMRLCAQGAEYPEIAEILDLPLGTVKRRLHDGRQKARELRERLAS